MAISLATLLVQETKAMIYETALGVASAIGLPVSTWRAGDPTRSLYHLEAETLSALESLAAGYISSGFIDFVTGDWRKVMAEQFYGVVVPEATFASTSVTLTNAGGLDRTIDPGDITFKNSSTGKTYRNTSGGHLGPVGTLDAVLVVDVVADEAGSDSSAAAGEIDELVTTMLGVTCTNVAAAIGTDEQDWNTTKAQCLAKLDTLSANGPSDVYEFVARDRSLTGTSAVSRARSYGSRDTGDVTLYLAGPGGGVPESDRALVEEAVIRWATPLCTTVTVLSAEGVVVPITYELWCYRSANKTAAEIEELVQDALETLFASRDIGGDIIPPATSGYLYRSLIESTIRGVLPEIFRVAVSTPGDTALSNAQVASLGTVSATINLVVG